MRPSGVNGDIPFVGGLDAAAREFGDRRADLQAFQAGDLLTLLANDLLQGRDFAKQVKQLNRSGFAGGSTA